MTAFVALGLVWGSNFVFMKWASETITAGQITLLRVVFAFAAGTSLLPSGIAGALSGAIPLFSFLSAAVFLRSEQITLVRLLGILIGFSGVLLIARPWATTSAVDMTGVLYTLVGSASVGLSFVYAKKFLSDLDIAPVALTILRLIPLQPFVLPRLAEAV